jgi:hypothetical protein
MSKAPGVLHTAGSVLFILCGIAHAIGQFAPDPHSAEMAKRIRTFTIPGTTWNYWDVMQVWGALYGAMTVLFGVILLASARASGGDPRVIRTTSLIGAIAALAQFVFVIVYRTPPPLYFMIPAGSLFLLAARWPERTPG